MTSFRGKRRAALTALLLCAAVFLGSCAGDTPSQESTAADGTLPVTEISTEQADLPIVIDDSFIIVRPDGGAGSALLSALSALRNGILDKYGVAVTPKTDWLNTRAGEQPAENEILLGLTNRPESALLAETLTGKYQYAIAVVDGKLTIAGGSEQALAAAVNYLLGALPDKPEFAKDYEYRGEIPMSERTVYIKDEIVGEHVYYELAEGVTFTGYSLPETSAYGLQKFSVIEFDPKQSNLRFRVTGGGDYAAKLVTVKKTVERFNSENTDGLRAIAAINGDLWMVSYAHARVEGGTTTYKNYSDYVVTKPLSVPRGFNMYNGEIITSAHMRQETPYEGDFYSFGISEDGEARLGKPQVSVRIADVTSGKTTPADGVNRLPANDALVVYTDAYAFSNYSLSNAREIVIDVPEGYFFGHGSEITGKVTAVTEPGGTKYEMQENRIILTARGSRLSMLEGFSVGDTVTLSVTVTDTMGGTAFWQKVKNAVGGHIPVIINGKSQGSSDGTNYPMSVLGIKDNGNVVMLTNDGRQSGWSTGIKISQLDELCSELGIVTAFILDGGGSAEMVTLQDGEYKTVNRPSDGSSRSVVNTVILAIKEG
ncbi:MAG: phosphodiester glycosidase family protein [Clostridia bacterium]|nr:phosphodiester glycosidase family protein [Clostridia bacterium]